MSPQQELALGLCISLALTALAFQLAGMLP